MKPAINHANPAINPAVDGERRTGRLPRTMRRPVLLLAALLAPALVLTGCGSSGADGSTTSSSTGHAEKAAAGASGLQGQFVSIVKQVGPSVVLIRTKKGLGSGIVLDGHGDVVTNDHVVDGSRSFQVTLPDGKRYHGTLAGTFRPDDLAVIHINASGLAPATFADSSKLAVGDVALAIGNPLGLQSSVTDGIVSALGRTVNEDNGVALPDVIQTSAPINPGNSGGALVDLHGQVIGIPTLAATDPQLGGGSAPGIGFAIPSNTVRDIAGQLTTHGKVTDSHRAYLGVGLAATTRGGVLVASIRANGPAAHAGITAGDFITAVNDTTTPDPGTLADVLAKLDPGQVVKVSITQSHGGKRTVGVRLGSYPG